MTIKPIKTQQKPSIIDGFRFGLGFWVAFAIVNLFFIPGLFCLTVLILSMLGQSINQLIP